MRNRVTLAFAATAAACAVTLAVSRCGGQAPDATTRAAAQASQEARQHASDQVGEQPREPASDQGRESAREQGREPVAERASNEVSEQARGEQPRKPTLVRLGPQVLGKADAPVTIVEFTDLQCPFCVKFYINIFPEVRKRFIDTGIARFTTRDFPLAFHGYAVRASRAVRCAGEQDRFWDLRRLLSENAARLADEVVLEAAGSIGISMSPFRACLDSGRFEEEIRQDQAEALAAGVTGTPTFLIGPTEEGGITTGYRLVGARPVEDFEEAIRLVREKRETGGTASGPSAGGKPSDPPR